MVTFPLSLCSILCITKHTGQQPFILTRGVSRLSCISVMFSVMLLSCACGQPQGLKVFLYKPLSRWTLGAIRKWQTGEQRPDSLPDQLQPVLSTITFAYLSAPAHHSHQDQVSVLSHEKLICWSIPFYKRICVICLSKPTHNLHSTS